MPADELGSVWNSDPVRVTQAIKSAGKELDREKKEHEEEPESPEREHDSFELSSEEEKSMQTITIHQHSIEDDELIPGSKIDVTIG